MNLEEAWLGKMRAGKRHFDRGQSTKAINAFSKATKLNPQRVEGWINLGSTLLDSGRYAKALVVLEKALSMQPDLMLPQLILGDVLRELGRWPEAIASYRKAVSMERSPLGLNKLACAVRVEDGYEQAEGLYLEAIEIAPDFTLARVNLASLQVTRGRFEKARELLDAVAVLSLPPTERYEVDAAQLAISEYFRLNEAIAELSDKAVFAPLETLLRSTPIPSLQVDENTIGAIARYTDSAKRVSTPASPASDALPEEWPLIEALFMIPHVNSVSEYLAVKVSLEGGLKAKGDLLESTNMEPAIFAARSNQFELQDPVKAELHMRHWHALACRGLNGFMPGHFKYTQNWSPGSPALTRVEPTMASGTFRRFIDDFYQSTPLGIARAALVCMAVCDLHAFADGNGRVGIIWLNRELEWAGLAPALFSRELGVRGKLGAARREVRNNRGNLAPLIAVIAEAQQFGHDFCSQLASAR